MKVLFTERALRSYANAPEVIQSSIDKQIRLLSENLRHPSLRAKKYDESKNIWQARVTQNWRFYFTIKGDTYQIIDVMPHPK